MFRENCVDVCANFWRVAKPFPSVVFYKYSVPFDPHTYMDTTTKLKSTLKTITPSVLKSAMNISRITPEFYFLAVCWLNYMWYNKQQTIWIKLVTYTTYTRKVLGLSPTTSTCLIFFPRYSQTDFQRNNCLDST
jgi:hypothetical protein